MSPSMDILISSNLERLLWFIAGADATRGFMESLTSGGSYTVPARVEVSGYDVGAVGAYEVTVHIG